MPFTFLCQKLIDAWLYTDARTPAAPEAIYSEIMSSLTIRMRLAVIETDSDEPKEWLLRPVRQTRITSRIMDLNSVFKGGRLGDIKDQDYIESSVLPAYTKAIRAARPVIDAVETKLLGVRVVYDRIILPQRAETQPQWLVVCTNGRFMSGTPANNPEIDATDQAILTALLEGMTVKEIGAAVGLSPPTVEHRLERVKKQTGARSLPHLAALIVTAGFDRSIRHTSED
ncbi:LuxR C-terminal-related transcriptional regulator [Sinorhizobium chiapasense]